MATKPKKQQAAPAKARRAENEREAKEVRTKLKNMRPLERAEVVNDVIEKTVTRQLSGFIEFIREQGVVGLGIGFVVGTAATTLVKSIVSNIFNPIIGVLMGGIDLTQRKVCIKSSGSSCASAISYGQVASDLLTFLIILLLVYMLMRSLRLDQLVKKKK